MSKLTFEEIKKDLQAFSIPCYGMPEFISEDENFIYYKVAIPKILVNCSGSCDGGSCCGSSCTEEKNDK